jgi:hypothetical protein
MPSYQEATQSLSTATGVRMTDLWSHLTAGDLAQDDFLELAGLLVLSANTHATTLADVGLASRLSQLTGSAVDPLGLVLSDAEADRIGKAIATSLDTVNPGSTLNLVGRSEPLRSGQLAYNQGLREHGVSGWRRVTRASACQSCRDLAQATWLPNRITMWHHAGCSCHPEPVLVSA